jgi:hypothetical protein
MRPRSSSGCQRLDLLAEVELSSVLLSELGGGAWSSPACGGRGTEVLDCFLLFTSKVLFVKCEALSSNSWFFKASDDKGSYCKMYLPRVF